MSNINFHCDRTIVSTEASKKQKGKEGGKVKISFPWLEYYATRIEEFATKLERRLSLMSKNGSQSHLLYSILPLARADLRINSILSNNWPMKKKMRNSKVETRVVVERRGILCGLTRNTSKNFPGTNLPRRTSLEVQERCHTRLVVVGPASES